MKVYIVYDELANLPLACTLHQNDEAAKRSFVDLLTTPFTVVSDHPHQFKLLSFDFEVNDADVVMRGMDIEKDILDSKKLARLRMMHEAEDARLIKTMTDAWNAIPDSVKFPLPDFASLSNSGNLIADLSQIGGSDDEQ